MKIFKNGEDWRSISDKELKNRENTSYLIVETINDTVYLKYGDARKESIFKRWDHTGYKKKTFIKLWSSSTKDTEVHKLLQKHQKNNWKWAGPKDKNPLNTREAYIVENDNDIKKFIKFVDVVIHPLDADFLRKNGFNEPKFIPRKYQQNVIDKSLEVLKNFNKVLINLSTRAGKSFVSLKICKELYAKNILILTPYPSAEDSFEKLGQRNEEFQGYKYIHLTSKTTIKDFYDTTCEKAIIKVLQKLNFGAVILDECHNTSDSKRTSEILKQLSYSKLIYMSGTPFNDLYSEKFAEDQIVTFDFIDFIKYAKLHPEEIKLPNLHIYNICNMKQLNDWLISYDNTLWQKADAFKYSTIFGEARHAESFFEWLLVPKSKSFIVNNDYWFNLKDQNKIIAFFNTIQEAQKAADALKMKVGTKYKVALISGNKVDIEVNESEINKLFEENEKVIICSCGKLTTGVTLPALDTVWYFKSGKSSEQFVQILFRTMTEYENKTDVRMYCFDSEVSLSVMKNYASIRLDQQNPNATRGQNDTYQKVVEEFLSCINFHFLSDSNNNFKWEDEKVEDYLEKLHKIPYSHSIISILQNFPNSLKNISLNCPSISDKDLRITKPKGGNNVPFNEENKKIKNKRKNHSLKDYENNLASKGVENIKIVKQILYACRHIDRIVFLNDDICIADDLKKHCPNELKDYQNIYKEIIDLNRNAINQMIDDMRWKLSNNQIRDILQSLSFANNTDFSTPEYILEKMFNKFNHKSEYIFNPCCGRGGMLQYAVEKLGYKKENCFGIDIDEVNVKICHKLGFKNVICGDILEESTWKELVNLINMDPTKAFQNIIMNPPYAGKLYLKILDIVIKNNHDAEIVNLSPIKWLQDPLVEYSKNANYYSNIRDIIKNKLCNDIDNIDIKEFNNIFNTSSFFGVAIIHFSNNQNFDINQYKEKDALINKILSQVIKLPSLRSQFTKRINNKLFVPIRRRTHHYLKWTDNTCNAKEGILFKTINEKENFIKSLDTWIYKYLDKFELGENSAQVPYFNNYTNELTNEIIYKIFNLTNEEIEIINHIIN